MAAAGGGAQRAARTVCRPRARARAPAARKRQQRKKRSYHNLDFHPLCHTCHEVHIIFYGGVFKPAAAAPPRTKKAELVLDVAALQRRVLMARF